MRIVKGHSAKLLVDGKWVDFGAFDYTEIFRTPCTPHRWVVRKGRRARCSSCGRLAPQ